jgi:heme/copper-type cytochrome/quinol oxidase subunit 2
MGTVEYLTYFIRKHKRLIILFIIVCDSPENYQVRFQDCCSSGMEGIFEFNHHLLIIMVVIVCLIGWLLLSTLTNYEEFNVPAIKSFYHSDILEIVWTSIPALTLLSLAYPSYSLLYSMDEISVPDLAVKVSGHQWFWSYEISDFHLLATCHGADKSYSVLCDFSFRYAKGIRPRCEKESGQSKQVLRLPFRNAGSGLLAEALKYTLIGIGRSNRLSRRIPGNQDKMQQEEMVEEAPMGESKALLQTSVD